MASNVITSINTGSPLTGVEKSGYFPLKCKSSFTSNFGRVIPTYTKDFLHGSTIHVNNVRSLVRCAPLAVPTFGDMQLNHYHCFVPYVKLYEAFDALRSKTPYNFKNDTTIPSSVPMFSWSTLLTLFGLYISDSGIQLDPDFISTIGVYDSTGKTLIEPSAPIRTIVLNRLRERGNFWPIQIFISHDTPQLPVKDNICDLYTGSWTHYQSFDKHGLHPLIPSVNSNDDCYGTIEYQGSSYLIYVRYGNYEKRLRELMVGLGYGISYNSNTVSLLPLMAYYYAWFSIFGQSRNININSTSYALVKRFFETEASPVISLSNDNVISFGGFLYDLIFETCYTYAPDYYTIHTLDSSSNQAYSEYISQANIQNGSPNSLNVETNKNGVEVLDEANSLAQKLGMALLRRVNINTVVGRNVASWFKSVFHLVPESVQERICFGTDHISINVAKVISTAETDQAQIGEYRGFAMADGGSQHRFIYDVRNEGIYICLSVVVPKLGYFQGSDSFVNRLFEEDFYQPDFDSLGYEATPFRQFISDVYHFSDNDQDKELDRKCIGLRPRYYDYKVKNDVINGELRYNSSASQFSGYTLNRKFGSFSQYNNVLYAVTSDSFRKLDYFHNKFNLNNIFDSVSLLDDHFYVDLVFDVSAHMPMIPNRDSFMNQEQIGNNVVSKS